LNAFSLVITGFTISLLKHSN